MEKESKGFKVKLAGAVDVNDVVADAVVDAPAVAAAPVEEAPAIEEKESVKEPSKDQSTDEKAFSKNFPQVLLLV